MNIRNSYRFLNHFCTNIITILRQIYYSKSHAHIYATVIHIMNHAIKSDTFYNNEKSYTETYEVTVTKGLADRKSIKCGMQALDTNIQSMVHN